MRRRRSSPWVHTLYSAAEEANLSRYWDWRRNLDPVSIILLTKRGRRR